MTDHTITDADIQGLAEKLSAFCQTLSPGEAAAFQEVERQLATVVAPEEPDVQGYIMALELAHSHQSDLRAQAERDLRVQQAKVSSSQSQNQGSFWSSIITALTRQPQAKTGGATGN